MGIWMRIRSRPRWTAMKLRARALAAAGRGDAEAAARLLRAAADVETAAKGGT